MAGVVTISPSLLGQFCCRTRSVFVLFGWLVTAYRFLGSPVEEKCGTPELFVYYSDNNYMADSGGGRGGTRALRLELCSKAQF